MRPGITGLAQVNGNATMSWDERIKYDVYYVDHYSLLMDLTILGKTALVIAFGAPRTTVSHSDQQDAQLVAAPSGASSEPKLVP